MNDLLHQLDRILVRNTVSEWLIALGVALALVLVVWLAKRIAMYLLRRLAGRTQTGVDDALLRAVRATRIWLFAIIAIGLGSKSLELPGQVATGITKAVTIALFLQAGMWLWALAEFWLDRSRQRALESNPAAATGLTAMTFLARVLLWSVVLLMALDNLGVNVTTMIAGLGVGGIAVALAVQNILGDLFASLSIVIDKPFVIGDFVIVDEYMGTVENVGLKTTRIRSLGGEQIVFANGDLLKTRIRNYKRMRERRVVFGFRVDFATPVEVVEKIPSIVRAIIEARKNVRFDRAHFKSFTSALEYEAVYWMLDPDYNLYMDTQQEINLELMRALQREGVRLAWPTQTVVLQGALAVDGSQTQEKPQEPEGRGGASRERDRSRERAASRDSAPEARRGPTSSDG